MKDFLTGKTDVSPLTGRPLTHKQANELRTMLTADKRKDECAGIAFVRPPRPKQRGRSI